MEATYELILVRSLPGLFHLRSPDMNLKMVGSNLTLLTCVVLSDEKCPTSEPLYDGGSLLAT